MGLLQQVIHFFISRSAQYTEIADSSLFDPQYYLGRYPDVADAAVDPLVHFLRTGLKEGRQPHPLFQIDYYLLQHPEGDVEIGNPLVHYVRNATVTFTDPHPLFDTFYYVGQLRRDNSAGLENPLVHFLRTGKDCRYHPHPLFDSEFFMAQLAELGVECGQDNPLLLYLSERRFWQVSPHPLFDVAYYQKQCFKENDAPAMPLLQHYLLYGRSLGYDPHPCFDGDWYTYQHMKGDETVNPLSHYVSSGMAEGREPLSCQARNQVDDFLVLAKVDELGAFQKRCLRALSRLHSEKVAIVCLVAAVLKEETERFRKGLKHQQHLAFNYFADHAELEELTRATVAENEAAFTIILRRPVRMHSNSLAVIHKFLCARSGGADLMYTDHRVQSDGNFMDLVRKPEWSPELEMVTSYVGPLFVVRHALLHKALFHGNYGEMIWSRRFAMYLANDAGSIAHIPYAVYSLKHDVADEAFLQQDAMNDDKNMSAPAHRLERPPAATAMASIIVGVQTRNELEQLNLARLYQTIDGMDAEVLLSCFLDLEEEAAFLAERYPGLRIVLNDVHQTNSYAILLNRACKAAKGDWLLFLQPDEKMVERDYLDRLVLFFQDQKGKVLGLHNWRGQPASRWLSFLSHYFERADRFASCWPEWVVRGHAVVHETPLVEFHGMAVTRHVFWSCEGFSPLYRKDFYGYDLCMRAREKNASILELVLTGDLAGYVGAPPDVLPGSLDSHLFLDLWRPTLKRELVDDTSFLFDLQTVLSKNRVAQCKGSRYPEASR